MAIKSVQHENADFEIANLLYDAADAMRKRSRRAYAADRMSLDEFIGARARELELRSELSVMVTTDLSETLEAASEAGASIEQAILDATARIESVRSVESALKIVASLVSLAAALAAGDVKPVLKARNAVAELT